jgi:sugar/nucleoside kinase (ribokinase family)
MNLRVHVFGPAYLDRVLKVEGPLVDPRLRPPIDQSVDGEPGIGGGLGLELADPSGNSISIEPPDGWPGPFGKINLSGNLLEGGIIVRSVRGLAWHDDLGGMGAGYAAALRGTLWSALGANDDATSGAIIDLLARYGIDHRPIRLANHAADWTLLVTSAGHGDKLAIGFRGCHAAVETGALENPVSVPCDLRIAAALPNRLAAFVLCAPGSRCRFFAPSMRNLRDREHPVSAFASSIDVLSCNRREWEALADREEVAWRVSILVVTEGPAGSSVRFTTPQGEPGIVRLPAFPRTQPPRDTNRAGESFAAFLVKTLLSEGWNPASAVADECLMRHAMLRASAAAALVLDRVEFGFPDDQEIEAALRDGKVA